MAKARKERVPEGRVDLAPCSPFGALLEERQRALERQVAEIRSRVNGLIFLVLGAVVVELVLRVMG